MIIGHPRQIAYLSCVLEKGALAHAYLFHGPEGVGKRTTALAIARALLCEQQPPVLNIECSTGCEACRLVAALAHPDLLVLSPERLLVSDERKHDLGIKQIQELRRQMAGTAWRGGWRTIIVDQAERLSREAESALLKTLEEPRPRTVFFLISQASGAIPPTIRSRCVEVHFSTLGDDELQTLAGDLPPADRRELLAIAAGRPGVALRLAREPEFRVKALAEEREFQKLLSSDLPEQFAFSEAVVRDPERLAAFFRFLLRTLRGGIDRAPEEGLTLLGEALRRTLGSYALLQTTAANRRLLADGVFLTLLKSELKSDFDRKLA